MAKGVYDADSDPVSFKGWTWGVEFDDLIGQAVKRVLNEHFEDNPPEVSLWYRGEGDPATFAIELPLTDGDYMMAAWKVSLTDVIDDWASSFQAYKNKTIIDFDGVKFARQIAARLREEADRLESMIGAGPTPAASPPA